MSDHKCLYCGDPIRQRLGETPSRWLRRRACSNRCSAFVREMKKPEVKREQHKCPLCATSFIATADQMYRVRNNVSLVFCSMDCSRKGKGLSRAFNAKKIEDEQTKDRDVASLLNQVLFSWGGIAL